MNCRNNTFSVTNLPPLPIFLGYPGENNSRPVSIDVSPWLEEFPDGSVSIDYTRADKLTYAVIANQPGPIVTWKPQRRDLVEGSCKIQLRIKQGDDVKKERIIACKVGESLDDPNDPPEEPRPTYVEEAIAAADRAEAAVSHYPKIVNGVWFVWDAAQSKFVSTGISAQGEDGVSPTVTVEAITGGHRVTITDASGGHVFDVMDGQGGSGGSETVVVTIDDTTDPMTASMNSTEIKAAVDAAKRVIVRYDGAEIPYLNQADTISVFSTTVNFGTPTSVSIFVSANAAVDVLLTDLVQSVNGQTGAVTVKEPFYLTVTTENGTRYVDKTPAEINALSMAGYDVHARIPDVLGFVYDLRFVGYLASANLAALASEYSGKSISILVDATKAVEYSAIDFASWIDRIEVNVGNLETVKADKTEIPSLSGYATETWVQNHGYQTAQDVQTAIAGKADKVPRIAKASTDTSATLDPNALYVFPEMAELTITLATPTDTSVVNEYHFIFVSGATATVTDFPQIPGLDDFAAEANTAYEISILEGHALVVSWEVTA